MESPQKPVKRAVVVALLLSVVVAAIDLFGCWYSVAPYGSDFLYRYVSVYLLSYFLILILYNAIYLALEMIGLLFGRRKTNWLTIGTTSAFFGVLLVLMFVTIGLNDDIRKWGYRGIAARGATLVTAIKQYQVANGAPPESLDNLVPKYLPTIPGTGVGAYPDYDYITNTNSMLYGGNHWVLSVNLSTDNLSHDALVFYPNGKYPSGPLDSQLGDWAFVSTSLESGGKSNE